ncbi:class I SAM-dependent methyltransferase [Paenibacillus antri]|uniref:class I SAM-dependent methyltransferase n=1 Tax=Paenibacillus antri TaxID=2582848 RepID=UPI0013053D67|nr:class I SAM-dependent methyltransferase [Paenibacillus antri]
MNSIDFQFSPGLYHRFVRPKWLTKKYIHDPISMHFPLDRRSVLDFGCGTGANCTMVSPEFYVGVDADDRRTRFASRLHPGYTFHPLASETLPLDDQSIDYVWIIAVLHHIPCDSIPAYVKEFRRILKPGGRVIVMEPFLSDRTPLSNRFMRWWDRGRHIRGEDGYVKFFADHQFSCDIHQKFRKCFLYNELFFSAKP